MDISDEEHGGNPFAEVLSTELDEGPFVGWDAVDVLTLELLAMCSNRERFGDFASKLLSDTRSKRAVLRLCVYPAGS